MFPATLSVPSPATARRWLTGAAAVAAVLMPAAAFAQAGGGGGRRAGGGMAMALAGTFREALDQIGLPADAQAKADDALAKAQADVRDQMQALRDAAPEDRPAKMKDIQKTMTDARDKVEADLTPDQKTMLFQKVAQLTVGHATDGVAAEKKAAAAMDVPDDQKKQLATLFDDTAKELDGYKSDADAVKDEAAGTVLQQKVVGALTDENKQLAEVLGQDDARQVQRAGVQAMRPAAAGGAQRRTKPTTGPAADAAK